MLVFQKKLLSCDINIPTPGTDILLEKRSFRTKAKGSQFFMDENHVMTMEALNVIRDLSHHGRQPLSIVLKGRDGTAGDAVGAGFLLTPRTHHFLMIKQIPSGQSLHRFAWELFFITEGSQMCQEIHTTQKQHQPGRQDLVYIPQALTPQWDNP